MIVRKCRGSGSYVSKFVCVSPIKGAVSSVSLNYFSSLVCHVFQMAFVTLSNDVIKSRPPRCRSQASVGGRYVRYGQTRLILNSINLGQVHGLTILLW